MLGLFSACQRGGTTQFATTLANYLKNNKKDYIWFAPDGLSSSNLEDINIIKYSYDRKKFLFSKYLNNIVKIIKNSGVDEILFVEDTLLTLLLIKKIKAKINTSLVIHDVKQHLEKKTPRSSLLTFMRMILRKFAFPFCKKIFLLSEYSQKIFARKYSKFLKRSHVIKLGSHLPEVEATMPIELNEIKHEFYLFFGRIDKYKGVDILLSSYNKYKGDINLVIAGTSICKLNNIKIIERNNNIKFLNRYISDSEMCWLFINCRAVILPYIEASQSGVLPIAFSMKKPVIASDIEAFKEFVINGYNGLIIPKSDIEKYTESFYFFENTHSVKEYGNNAYNFYIKNLCFNKNAELFFK